MPDDAPSDDAPADEARAADGRRPGRRGLATRQKLLDCTAEMLGSGPYRELKVVDIARAAGTSPATFYQYFADVESAVVVGAGGLVIQSIQQARAPANGATTALRRVFHALQRHQSRSARDA